MKHSYNSREQKIYLDYYKVSDAELQKIVENKKSYRDEIIVVIEDILVERGLLIQITLDPIKYEIGTYVAERFYEYNATKETVLEKIQNKYNLNEEEATKAIEQVYEEKKVEVLNKFPLKVPFDESGKIILIGMVLASLVDAFLIRKNVTSYLTYSGFFYFSIIRIVIVLFAAIYCGYRSYQLKREPISWVIFGLCCPVLAIIFISLARYKHPKEIHNLIKSIEEGYKKQVTQTINRESVDSRELVIQGIQEEMKALYEKIIVNYYVYKKLPTDSDKPDFTSCENKTYSFRYPNLIIWPAAIISLILIFSFVNSGIVAIMTVGLIVCYSVIVLVTKILSKKYLERYMQYETLGLVLLGYVLILLWYSWQSDNILSGISILLFSILLITLVSGYLVMMPKYFIGIHPMKIINDGKLYIFTRIEIVGIALFYYFLFVLTLSCIIGLSRLMEGSNRFHYLFWLYFHLPGKGLVSYYYIAFFTGASLILYAIRKHRTYFRVMVTGISWLFLVFSIYYGPRYLGLSKTDQKIKKSLIQEEVKQQKDHNFN